MIRKLLTAGIVVVLLIAGIGGYVLLKPGSGSREVVIPVGATTVQIGRILQREGVIGSDALFEVGARLRRLDGRIQAGRYELSGSMGILAALNALARGPEQKGTGVTVPEGYSLAQISQRVDAKTHISGQGFLAAAQTGGIRASMQPPTVSTLEGFLFPETYFVADSESAMGLARRMVQEFERRTADLKWSLAETHSVSPYQALIIASLVEREAKVAEDRSKVAAVIYNRLAKGMRLQIDITALYGLNEHKVPTRADLRRPSPYNTYLIDGLPPTPIASPGLASINAALHPAPIDALYYVVIDPSGKHGFTSDPQEFERLKQRRPAEVH